MILTRETEPDRVSRLITQAQIDGGYHETDARWTHAALYLGDHLTVCESTFTVGFGGPQGVVHTPLWNYCGDSAVRVRRPLAVQSAEEGFLLAITALTQLKKDYDFRYILSLAWRAFSGKGFWSPGVTTRFNASALVCSTLYADAYTRFTRRALGEQNNGICTPAYLSQCPEFEDIEFGWLAI